MKSFENWIDFMEEEVNEDERSELELLLRHSVSDRMVYDNLLRLREQIKVSDPVKAALKDNLDDNKFYERLHRKTMSKIINSVQSKESATLSSPRQASTLSIPELDSLSPHIFYRIR